MCHYSFFVSFVQVAPVEVQKPVAIESDRRWCDTNVKRSTRQNIQTIQETQVHEKTTSFNKGARRTNSPYRIRIGQCDTPPVILKRETKKAEEQGMA